MIPLVVLPSCAARNNDLLRTAFAPVFRLAAPGSHAVQTHAPDTAYRLTWARLLARVFRVDPAVCPACGGTMKVIAALTDPPSIRTYLHGVGLTPQPPPVAPARPQPQTQFEYA